MNWSLVSLEERTAAAARRRGTHVWDAIGPVGPACTDLETFGMYRPSVRSSHTATEDESKRACGLSKAAAPCVVLSLGSNNQWAFEEDVFARTPCRIETFDCTLGSGARPPEHIAARTRLHRTCAGGANSTDDQGRQYLDWPSLLRQAGSFEASLEPHSSRPASRLLPPAFLKADCEGAELDLFSNMLDHRPLLPAQITVELHRGRTREGGRPVPMRTLAALVQRMWLEGGYTIVKRWLDGRNTAYLDVLLSRDLVDQRPRSRRASDDGFSHLTSRTR